MAYRRKSYRKRRPVKKRAFRRKTTYGKKKRKNVNYMSVRLTTTLPTIPIDLGNLTNNSATPIFRGQTVLASDCNNILTYTTMWDQYRIDKVTFKFQPVRTQMVISQTTNVTPGSVTNIPNYVHAIDFDDSIPTSYEDIEVMYGAREQLATRATSRTFVPRVLTSVYTGPLTTDGFITRSKQWIDCQRIDIPHYGLKMAIRQAEPNAQYRLEVKVIVHISFKNRRI